LVEISTEILGFLSEMSRSKTLMCNKSHCAPAAYPDDKSTQTSQEIQMSSLKTHAKTTGAQDLTADDMTRLKSRLLQQVKELAGKDGELRARLAAEESATTNTFVAGTEGAMAAEADDEVIALLRHEQMALAAAQEALNRIAHGDYGYCAECGDNIGIKRLEVLPEAHFCVGCQDMVEHRKGR
jgi:DnaK suppressor protein